jgi:hypothetical protein
MGTRYEESRQSRIFGGTRALAMSVKNFERTVLSEGERSVWRMDCRWSVRKPDGPGPIAGAYRKTSSRSSQGISIVGDASFTNRRIDWNTEYGIRKYAKYATETVGIY